MPAPLKFEPDARRAAELDAGMRRELATSLRYIAEQAKGVVAHNERDIERICAALDAGARYSPYLFASYYQLVLALLDGENARAEEIFARVARFEPIAERFRVAPLGEGASGEFADDCVAMMCAEASIDRKSVV